MVDVHVAWMSVAEAAHYARIGRTRLYEFVKSGALRPRKLGRRTLFAKAEIDAMIEAGAAPAAKAGRP
jgi:excisionase family DNA binding protein